MAVLMKYIYQNRRGVNSNFFSSLILFSFFIHLSFLERCQWSYQYLVCKNVSSFAQFSFFGKNLSAYSYLWTGSSSCNFRCGFTRMSDSTCIASVPRYFTQFLTRMNRWLSIYTHNCFHFNLEFLNDSWKEAWVNVTSDCSFIGPISAVSHVRSALCCLQVKSILV